MNTQLQSIFSDAEGRYLQNEEIRALAAYTSTLKERVETMQLLEKKEAAIVKETLDIVFEKHPDLTSRYFRTRENCTRDVTLVLRFCAMAMVRDDVDYLKEKLLYWLRTILQAFEFGAILDSTYRTLAIRVEAHLSASQARLMAPYLRATHEVLTAESTNV